VQTFEDRVAVKTVH